MRREPEAAIGEGGNDDGAALPWRIRGREHTSDVRAGGLGGIPGVEGARRSGGVNEDPLQNGARGDMVRRQSFDHDHCAATAWARPGR
jgi:hypothetical protein